MIRTPISEMLSNREKVILAGYKILETVHDDDYDIYMVHLFATGSKQFYLVDKFGPLVYEFVEIQNDIVVACYSHDVFDHSGWKDHTIAANESLILQIIFGDEINSSMKFVPDNLN